jgi:hypothetical protein
MATIDRESAVAALVAQHRSGFLAAPAPAEACSELLADLPAQRPEPAWYRWAMDMHPGGLFVGIFVLSILVVGVPLGALLAIVFG